jgi:hypothetical protein
MQVMNASDQEHERSRTQVSGSGGTQHVMQSPRINPGAFDLRQTARSLFSKAPPSMPNYPHAGQTSGTLGRPTAPLAGSADPAIHRIRPDGDRHSALPRRPVHLRDERRRWLMQRDRWSHCGRRHDRHGPHGRECQPHGASSPRINPGVSGARLLKGRIG